MDERSFMSRRPRMRAFASAKSPVLLRGQLDQLRPGRDTELGEDLAEVIVDRSRAQEELRGHLAVGGAPSDDPDDLRLLRGELPGRADVALAGRLPGGAQIAARQR